MAIDFEGEGEVDWDKVQITTSNGDNQAIAGIDSDVMTWFKEQGPTRQS